MPAFRITHDCLRTSRRRLAASLTVAAVFSLTVMVGVSFAASLQVGKNNKSSGQTSLTSSSKKKTALAVSNTGGAAAASFTVKKNKTPFTVSSSTKVKNLNADLLDGLDSSKLQLRVGGTCGAGSAVSAVNGNGSVSCATFPAVPSNVQTRVGGTCAPSSAIRIINPDGTVVCQPVLVSVPPAWNLTGNAGTDPTTDFLGTTDNQPLVIKTNNTEAMRVTPTGSVGIGTTAPGAQLDVSSTTQNAIRGSVTTGAAIVANSTNSDGINTTGGANGVTATGTGNGIQTSGGQDGVLAFGGKDAVEARGTGIGVFGASDTGIGVLGNSGNTAATGNRGVVGTLHGGSCAPGVGTGYAVGGCGSDQTGVQATSQNNGVYSLSTHPSGGGTAAAVLGINDGGGDIFIGATNLSGTTHVFRVDSSGKGFFDGGTQTGGADYAESIHAVNRSQLHPGDVLSIAPSHGYAVSKSNQAYSTLVVGVYSSKPAVLAVGSQGVNASLSGQVPVAMMGVVPTKVTAAGGAVHPGDLLTTSRVAGYAMKARATKVHGIAIYPQGTIVGKALQSLSHGQATIEVMLMSR